MGAAPKTHASMRIGVPDDMRTRKRTEDADTSHPALLAAAEITNKAHGMGEGTVPGSSNTGETG